MPVELIYLPEPGFSAEQELFEHRIWRQLKGGYAANKLTISAPARLDSDLSIARGELVFLLPENTARRFGRYEELYDFRHPENATYVFGSSACNLTDSIAKSDHVVCITTPEKCELFGSSAAAAVLYARDAETSMGAGPAAMGARTEAEKHER